MENGIDYGMGQTNIDKNTGIRFGVIQINRLNPFAWEELEKGKDLDYQAWREEKIESIRQAIAGCFDGEVKKEDIDGESILDSLDIEYPEWSGDCIRYEYKLDGYHLQTTANGEIFVLNSPYVTRRGFCSPCAPGACHLETEGGILCYCLGDDWFDDEFPCPYKIEPVPHAMGYEGNHSGETD